MIKLTFMAKITKCRLSAWYLPVTLWVFLEQKNPWLVFRVKHKNLKQNFFVFFSWKKTYHTILKYEKNAYHTFFHIILGIKRLMKKLKI